MQEQVHTSKQRPDTSQRYRRQRLIVTLILLLSLGATVGILIHQGVISSSWLVALPWVGLAVLVLVFLWAALWLLRDYGRLSGSRVRSVHRLILLVVILAILGFCIWAIVTDISAVCSSSHGDCWTNPTNRSTILSNFIPMCGVVAALFQVYLMIFPPKQPAPVPAVDPSPQAKPAADSAPQVSSPQVPQPLNIPILPARSLVTLPPLTDPGTIEQREAMVKDIYARLTAQNTNAIVLTGIGGAGKSTLAALVYRYEEKQRKSKQSEFLADPLWLTIKESVTMGELASVLLESLGAPIPSAEMLPPPQQALALFHALNSAEKPRLIVLDQFETLLNPYSGQILPERPGIGEWLDALNSNPSRCRLVFTSRWWPKSERDYPQAYMKEYPVERLSTDEGVELLRKQGVAESQATEAELRTAVERCQGHPLSLTLLASILRKQPTLHLKTLLTDPLYVRLWQGRIADSLLDFIYHNQLNELQRQLLCAFSIYREAVPLQAAQALLTTNEQEVLDAWEVLRTQHLLQDTDEVLYRLHPIVAEYALNHFNESSEQANQQALKEAHAKAAEYYLQLAKNCLPREQRHRVADVQPIIEAIWHLCQAEKWQEAFELMKREYIFTDVSRWGGNVLLLELCLQFLPVAKWHPERLDEGLIYSRVAYIYNALGQKQEALGYYEQALVIAREVGDRKKEGTTLNNLGGVYDALGQKQEALDYYQQALAIWKEVGDRRGEGTTLNNLGLVYQALGQKQEALNYYEQALAIVREVGDRRNEGGTLNNLGHLYNALGQKQEALRYYEQALAIRKEVRDRRGEGTTLNNLGLLYNALGQKQEALRYYEQALAIRKEVGDRGGEGTTLNNLGGVYDDLGQKQEALRYYGQALAILREVGDRGVEGITLHNIGMIYFEIERYDVALACFWQARLLFLDVQSPHVEDEEQWIERIAQKVGEQQFARLVTEVKARAAEIVEQALRDGLE